MPRVHPQYPLMLFNYGPSETIPCWARNYSHWTKHQKIPRQRLHLMLSVAFFKAFPGGRIRGFEFLAELHVCFVRFLYSHVQGRCTVCTAFRLDLHPPICDHEITTCSWFHYSSSSHREFDGPNMCLTGRKRQICTGSNFVNIQIVTKYNVEPKPIVLEPA